MSREEMLEAKEDLLNSIAEGKAKLEKLEESVVRTKFQLDQFEKTVIALAAMIGSEDISKYHEVVKFASPLVIPPTGFGKLQAAKK